MNTLTWLNAAITLVVMVSIISIPLGYIVRKKRSLASHGEELEGGKSKWSKRSIAWFGLALILLGIGLTIYKWGPTWFPKGQKDTSVSMIEPQRSASPTVTKTSRCSTEIRRVRVGNDLAKIDWKGCRLVLELEDERARIKILTGPDKYNLTLESGPGGYKKGDRLKIRNIRYRSIYIQTIQPGTQANVIFILCPLTSEIKGMGCVLLDGSFHGLYGAQTRPREKSTRFENGDSHNANPRFFFYF